MLPELLYEIYKYFSLDPETYLSLKAIEDSSQHLKQLVGCFRGPYEGKMLRDLLPFGENYHMVRELISGVSYVVATNPSLIRKTYYGYIEKIKFEYKNLHAWSSRRRGDKATSEGLRFYIFMKLIEKECQELKHLVDTFRENWEADLWLSYHINIAGYRYDHLYNKNLEHGIKYLIKNEHNCIYFVNYLRKKKYLLSILANTGSASMVNLLLKNDNIDPSVKNNEALVNASRNGHSDIVELLLKHPKLKFVLLPIKSDIRRSIDGNGWPAALGYAAYNHDIKIVKLLILDERIRPLCGQYIYIMKCAINNIQFMQFLLLDGTIDPGIKDSDILQYAIQTYDPGEERYDAPEVRLEVIKLLLNDPRVDPSSNNNLALKLACKRGAVELVKLLLDDPRVDPSDNNNAAIKAAVESKKLKVVELLLRDRRVCPHNDIIQTAVMFTLSILS